MTLAKTLFNLSLQIERLLNDLDTPPPTDGTKSGIKLPKINVPTFDTDVLNWNRFWQQFNVVIHSKAQFNDAEKLAYLRDLLKYGPARHIIEGLARNVHYYKEAIGCLQRCYDQLRVIQQVHIHATYEAPSLRDGNGQELHRLLDMALHI